jgi:hypothetical protein
MPSVTGYRLKVAPCLVCRYLGLGNEREEFFKLTTPLFISKDETFSLLVPGYGVRP